MYFLRNLLFKRCFTALLIDCYKYNYISAFALIKSDTKAAISLPVRCV